MAVGSAQRQGAGRWGSYRFNLLLLLLSFPSSLLADQVHQYEQKANTEDDLLEILEEEQFLMSGPKQRQLHHRTFSSKARNSSQPSPAPQDVLDPAQNGNHVTNLSDVSSGLRLSGSKTNLEVMAAVLERKAAEKADEEKGEEDEMDDFLVYNEEVEAIERAEEMRRAQERDLQRRIKRAAAEGSGAESVDGNIAVDVPYDNDFADSSSTDYGDLKDAAKTEIEVVLESKGLTDVAVDVTGFSEGPSGGTVIELTMSVDEGRLELAQAWVSIWTNTSDPWVLIYKGQSYSLLREPQLEKATAQGTFEVVSCTVCTCLYAYKECLQDSSDDTVWFCQTKSEHFLDFGPNQGDSTLTRGKARLSQKVTCQVRLPANEKLYKFLFISMHGCISVGWNHKSFDPTSSVPGGNFLLCAHWANMELPTADDRANVWYQVYEKDDSCTANDQAMLNSGAERVELYANITDYSPTCMLVATFEDMLPYGTTDSTERVNFQMTVISNGITAYALFVYAQGGMLWKSEANRAIAVLDGLNRIEVDPDRLDVDPGNTGQPGVFWYSLTEETANAWQTCLDFHCRELPKSAEYKESLEDKLPICHCDKNVTVNDNDFEAEAVENNVACFRSKPNLAPQGTKHAKRCCYDDTLGSFLTSDLTAGSFELFHPDLNLAGYEAEDEQPRTACCQDSDLCDKFYEVRPKSQCGHKNITQSQGAGDPHFTTLDGANFTFNAIGEFLFTRLTKPAFELQARTAQAIDRHGKRVAASVFSAFAGQGGGVQFQVEMNQNRTEMYVFLRRRDITQDLKEKGKTIVDGGWSVKMDVNIPKIDVSFAEDGDSVGFRVTLQNRLLDIAFTLNFDRSTLPAAGLLGNHNGDPGDDFIFRNGTTLPADTSERDLLSYGKDWTVTGDENLFQYPEGFDTDYFTDKDFMPVFLSEIPESNMTAARALCETDLQCIYDFVVTANRKLAVNTKSANVQLKANIQTAANRAPSVDGPATVRVTRGQLVNISFVANDQDDDATPTYVFDHSLSGEEFVFDEGTQTVRLTPNTTSTFHLGVAVRDSQGVFSPSLQVQVLYCTGCSDNGECNFDNLRDTGDLQFRLATCDCEPFYAGDDCDENLDACVGDPCPLSTNCTDLTVQEHKANGSDKPGFTCSDCPEGYTQEIIDTSIKCRDVDECTERDPCMQTCTNVEGSYLCTCLAGYRQDISNHTLCTDIDECQENTHTCQQECVNLVSSFRCDCFSGFSVNASDSNLCVKDPDVDPCAELNCTYACSNESGVLQCVCPSGYAWDDDQLSCKDIIECDLNQCSQQCTNTEGSYTCSCQRGYQLHSDKVTCNACLDFTFGENCQDTCACRGRGTCDSVKGCVCQEGWTGTTCSTDVDECQTVANVCPFGQICRNTEGSFTCVCPAGFQKVNVTKCIDIDECARATDNNCQQVCSNTPGSYVCSCDPGFSYVPSNNTCVDIDECATNTDNCEYGCENFPGSANCICGPGFILTDDRRSCSKVLDPCESLAETKSCEYACRVDNDGAAQCYCQDGYKLASDGVNCIDINECLEDNKCDQQCDNSPGNYQCSCSNGYTLGNDQRTCVECDSNHWGEDCSEECDCNPLGSKTCDRVTGCVCADGWQGTQCQADVNECALQGSCQELANAQCINTAGSFRCRCQEGYETNSDVCVDTDECKEDQPNPCDQTCTNTDGSYQCSCDSGFNSVGQTCVDIDECLTNPCDQICRNTVGGFACECEAGFLLDATTRNTCYAQTECGSNTCEHGCVVKNSQQVCFCPAGYVVNATNSDHCDDIDECLQSPCINGTCANSPGKFNCSCSNGTYLLPDFITCQVCPQGKHGADCDDNCTCVTAHTQSCDPVTGNCTCNDGWEGDDCERDEKECTDTPTLCDSVLNSECVNTNGSYECRCNVGFFKDFENRCNPCDDVHFGLACSQDCACERANTADCNDINGTCNCKPEWKGENCTQDVDECISASDPCRAELHETCRNVEGGHFCDCVTGYERPSPGDNCTDQNECLSRSLCSGLGERCVNTDGSYECVCSTGFSNVSGACQATFSNYAAQLNLNMNFTSNLLVPTSAEYIAVEEAVEEAVNETVTALDDDAYHGTEITNISEGSVIVDAVIQLYDYLTDNPPGLVAKAAKDLLDAGVLTIGGENVSLLYFTLNGTTLTSDSSECDALTAINPCNSTHPCALNTATGLPECLSADEEEDMSLVIGLGVGIPLAFLAVLAIAVLIYIVIRRRHRHSSSDADSDRSGSIFASKLPTMGHWSVPHGALYAPDNRSVSMDSDNSEGHMISGKGARKARSDFRDSAWYDRSRPFTSPASESAHRSAGAGLGSSTSGHFSWEYIFRLLGPYDEDRPFSIQRPHVSSSPDPEQRVQSRRNGLD